MFDLDFKSRMAISLVVTFLFVGVSFVFQSLYFFIGVVIGTFGYQIIDWSIYQLKNRKNK